MNQLVQDMLKKYESASADDFENALREICQEIALLGLWRGNFFENAAFYGGTALRILHGLQRFSEDMDFSLLSPAADFDFASHIGFIEKELSAWGFSVTMEKKKKRAASAVESAFLKAHTWEQMIVVNAPEALVSGIHRSRRLRIKVEVDTDPPPGFSTETRYLLSPIPFAVRSYTLSSLFAGKMHALLFRKWKNRVKGRDWFDFIWFVAAGVPVDLAHLAARMAQTGHWEIGKKLSEADLSALLVARICEVDFDAARADIRPFLKQPEQVDLWSGEFFLEVAQKVKGSQAP